MNTSIWNEPDNYMINNSYQRTSVWFQINRKMVNTISFRFDLIWFRKGFSVCTSPILQWIPAFETFEPESLIATLEMKQIRLLLCNAFEYTRRSLFSISLNHTRFGLWLHISDQYSTTHNSVFCKKLIRNSIIIIKIWVDLTWYRKYFCVCALEHLLSRVQTGPHWKSSHQLFEKLASLGIMGDQSRGSLSPPNTIIVWWSDEVLGRSQLGPHDAERRQSHQMIVDFQAGKQDINLYGRRQ